VTLSRAETSAMTSQKTHATTDATVTMYFTTVATFFA